MWELRTSIDGGSCNIETLNCGDVPNIHIEMNDTLMISSEQGHNINGRGNLKTKSNQTQNQTKPKIKQCQEPWIIFM